jgi:hypothetical protein
MRQFYIRSNLFCRKSGKYAQRTLELGTGSTVGVLMPIKRETKNSGRTKNRNGSIANGDDTSCFTDNCVSSKACPTNLHAADLYSKPCFNTEDELALLLKAKKELLCVEKKEVTLFLIEQEDSKHKMTSIPIDKDLAVLLFGRSNIC